MKELPVNKVSSFSEHRKLSLF